MGSQNSDSNTVNFRKMRFRDSEYFGNGTTASLTESHNTLDQNAMILSDF